MIIKVKFRSCGTVILIAWVSLHDYFFVPDYVNMGRIYKKKLGSRRYLMYNAEQLQQAVGAVKNYGMSYAEAARRYKINKKTLWNKVNGKHLAKPGGQPVLTEVEERHIVDVVVASAEYGSPITSLELRMIVKRYLDSVGKQISKFSDNLPGTEWALNFIDRHKDLLSQRTCQNIKGVRALKNEDEINMYFDNLAESLNNVPVQNIGNKKLLKC